MLIALLMFGCHREQSVKLDAENTLEVELTLAMNALRELNVAQSQKIKVAITFEFVHEDDGDRILSKARESGYQGTWYKSPMNEFLTGYLTKSISPNREDLKLMITQVRRFAHDNRAIQRGVRFEN